jgi:hypothetical protein
MLVNILDRFVFLDRLQYPLEGIFWTMPWAPYDFIYDYSWIRSTFFL